MKKLIIVTGGNGRFAKVLKENSKLNLKFLDKKKLNILDTNSIEKNIIKFKPKILLHCAALSRPMDAHYSNISKSIDLNIIGTSNVVKMCQKHNVKLIFFSTGYVYEGTKGNYKESDPVKPFNNYGLSKLAGELGLDDEHIHLVLGSTKHEVLSMAKDKQVDLIVAGSHGKHGLALLLGSTANAILNSAECDVLIVRNGK